MSETTETPTPPAPAPTPGPEVFSKDYVRELREENKEWRLKHAALEKEREEHKAAAEKAQKDAEDKIKASEHAARDRILRAELKAVALHAGIVDPEALKLADLSGVELQDDGSLKGAEAMLEALKKSKPYLFGAAPSSTSTVIKAPPAKTPEPPNAKNMTDEEYAVARKQFLNS